MYVVESSTGNKLWVEIAPVEKNDFKILLKKRYFFDWSVERNFEIYKLFMLGSKDIIGLISIERIPNEWRVHIRLLTVSKENQGRAKKYDRIAGNLIAHAARIAVAEYAELACVSLRPKSQIAKYYIDKYKMILTGVTLSIEVPEILNLINEYCHGA
jgi:hypothetical protein